jgi:probable F420-dependent oxidoreductase
MTAALQAGVMFPGDETGMLTRADIDMWADEAVACGFGHLVFGDHILGVSAAALPPSVREPWARRWQGPEGSRPYTHDTVFREPFVLFAYLAGRCALGLATSVMVLPQRQTALVAKQAAEVDLLCAGQLRLGVGTGWNSLEYAALGTRFGDRSELIEEQIEVLRLLWTRDSVCYQGKHHTLRHVGIQALPIQRPIPIWMGGDAPRVLERIGRSADGWFPPVHVRPGERAAECLSAIAAAARAAGRRLGDIAVEPRIYLTTFGEGTRFDESGAARFVDGWRAHGADWLCVDTRYGAQPAPITRHCERMRQAAAFLGLEPA